MSYQAVVLVFLVFCNGSKIHVDIVQGSSRQNPEVGYITSNFYSPLDYFSLMCYIMGYNDGTKKNTDYHRTGPFAAYWVGWNGDLLFNWLYQTKNRYCSIS